LRILGCACELLILEFRIEESNSNEDTNQDFPFFGEMIGFRSPFSIRY